MTEFLQHLVTFWGKNSTDVPNVQIRLRFQASQPPVDAGEKPQVTRISTKSHLYLSFQTASHSCYYEDHAAYFLGYATVAATRLYAEDILEERIGKWQACLYQIVA